MKDSVVKAIQLILLLVVSSGLCLCVNAQEATPSQANQAGSSIDRALEQAQKEIADALLIARIKVALLETLKADSLEIGVTAHDGAVAVTGEVASVSARRIAVQMISSLSGVLRVENQIRIRDVNATPSPVGQALIVAERQLTDGLLNARIKARLLDSLGRTGFLVRVDASDGIVTLTGRVPDYARRGLVVKITGQTTGVKRVRDQLVVGDDE